MHFERKKLLRKSKNEQAEKERLEAEEEARRQVDVKKLQIELALKEDEEKIQRELSEAKEK